MKHVIVNISGRDLSIDGLDLKEGQRTDDLDNVSDTAREAERIGEVQILSREDDAVIAAGFVADPDTDKIVEQAPADDVQNSASPVPQATRTNDTARAPAPADMGPAIGADQSDGGSSDFSKTSDAGATPAASDSPKARK